MASTKQIGGQSMDQTGPYGTDLFRAVWIIFPVFLVQAPYRTGWAFEPVGLAGFTDSGNIASHLYLNLILQ